LMKLRVGTAVAFGVGYTLGTKAGRQRYHQMARAVGHLRRSAPVVGTVDVVGDKARAVVTLGVERAKHAVGSHLGWRDGDEAADAITHGVANDVASALNGRLR
jgi:hypothetical protein